MTKKTQKANLQKKKKKAEPKAVVRLAQFTQENQDRILKLVSEGKPALEAARECGIKDQTFFSWLRKTEPKYAEFKAALDATREKIKPDLVLLLPEGTGFIGPPFLVERKKRFVDALSNSANIPKAAKAVGISSRTVERWCEDDQNFAELVFAAREYAIAEVEDLLFKNARNGNITAQLAILNAHDINYGQVRQEMIEKFALPLIERVKDVLQKHVPQQTLDAISAELNDAVLQVATGQSLKKRRSGA